jgi:sugar lactone lactonase YvrE
MLAATWLSATTRDLVANRVLGQSNFDTAAPSAGPGGLSAPVAIAIDRSSTPAHLYVADTKNNRVLGYRDGGAFSNGAPADIVIGQPDFLSTSCNPANSADAAPLCSPSGIAVDSIGNLYVADAGNNRVLEYDDPFAAFEESGQSAGFIASRVLGQKDFSSAACNDGADRAGADTLCGPFGLAIDERDRLYVAAPAAAGEPAAILVFRPM